MYEGRDMTELTMIPKTEWSDDEIHFYYYAMQQVTPYLNEEGKSIQTEILRELESRGGI